jgi:predicted dienelactone hydrolase
LGARRGLISLIDWTVLLAVLFVAGWRIIAPVGRWLLPSLGALCLLAVVQVLTEEFYWQFLPAYVLIAALGVSATRLRSKPAAWLIWFARTGLASLMVLSVAPFALLVPVPVLPAPTGSFAVGTEIYRWVDASRDEPAIQNPSDKRNVIAQAWYPAQAPGRDRSVYMDGLANLPTKVTGLPSFVLWGYDRIITHATLNAEISTQKLWPVVILSPGFGAPRAFYTGLAAELASRGYVVLALDHPYESAITQLADGTIATRIDTSPRDVDARDAWMAEQLNVRTLDVHFALDQLVQGAGRLKDHVDLSRVIAAGHSFGGATAVAAGRDSRIAAVANIDGTPYGELPVLQRPLLLLQSDYAVTTHGESFMTRNKHLLERTSAPAWRYEVLRANHVMFMDIPRFFAPPAVWALSQIFSGEFGGDLFGGNRGAVETQRVAADILDAFIRETLFGEAGAVTSAVARHSQIKGGRIEEGPPPEPRGP